MGRAVIAALVSSVVVLPLLAWRSSFCFSLGGPDSNPAAILAFTLAAVTSDILQGAGVAPAELVPAALMSRFLSASGCGLILFVMGRLGWGRYVRYSLIRRWEGFSPEAATCWWRARGKC